MKVKTYKELKIWQRSIDLATWVFKITSKFPSSQNFTLVNQIQRSAVSISSNIAEGSGRRSTKELLRFLNIAYGSLCELETQILISRNVGFIKDEDFEYFSVESTNIAKMINGFITKIENA